MIYTEITGRLEQHVKGVFIQNTDSKLFYHNLQHTQEVARRAIEIGTYYKLDEESLFIVVAAAWFHDIGYLFTGISEHEEKSARIMQVYLAQFSIPEIIVAKINNCILATKRTKAPANLLEEIICDADTYHFGTMRFRETNTLVKNELEAFYGIQVKHWEKASLRQLQNHQFYTAYCKQKLSLGKELNIAWLKPWYHSIQYFFRVRQ